MFEWLEKEISEIHTPGFHLLDGPADEQLREAVAGAIIHLPSSYKDFVLRFGNTKLYGGARTGYRLGVFAGPREAKLKNGTPAYEIGFHDGARVYLVPTRSDDRFSVFEVELGRERKVGENFEEWLYESCQRTRENYGAEKWKEIMEGPEPFSSKEKEVLEARRQIQWRVTGVDTEGNHVVEIINSSNRVLPVLTIGVRSKDRRLNGAVILKIAHISPGQTAEIHVDCYKNLVPPQEIELFSLPEPQPEERDQYDELLDAN